MPVKPHSNCNILGPNSIKPKLMLTLMGWYKKDTRNSNAYALELRLSCTNPSLSHTTKFMGPTWGPPGSCRPQMGPMNFAIRGVRSQRALHQCEAISGRPSSQWCEWPTSQTACKVKLKPPMASGTTGLPPFKDQLTGPVLTHQTRDRIAAILQMTDSNAMNESHCMIIQISIKFAPMGSINIKPAALVQITAW